MGCFNCCFGGGSSRPKDDGEELLPWGSSLQAEPRRGWKPARGQAAPAFGQGALRPDLFGESSPSPQQRRKQKDHSHYDPFAENAAAAQHRPAAVQHRPAAAPAAEGGWQAEPDWVRQRAAELAAEAAAAQHQHQHQHQHPPCGGKLAKLFSHGSAAGSDQENDVSGAAGTTFLRSASPQPAAARKQARSGARSRGHGGQQESLLPRAPAFGQGALTKWH
ncbi:translation initiation factor IF-2 [Micractinium conductrix]|uniref:Translation initiation factor IF-2 n=1 Tax=Micractinium conductrix TaxID=554055 RepID=A0A2P6VJF6_9CHLO|nr:translation initiation factor IF-2 [Micractinium conductrix]|eukprot:PSC74208.1 translation initiation factor IF-2 [Micractinium conductrix]